MNKKYLLIAILALSFSFTGMVAAEQGSDDSVTASTTATVSTSSDEQEDSNRGGGFFGLFRQNKDARQENRQEARTTFQENRDAIKQERTDAVTTFKENSDQLKQDFQANRDQIKADLQARRDQLKADIQNIKKERVANRKTFVETHFQNAITTLSTIIDRVQAKLTDLDGKGYDLGTAADNLAKAKTALAAAQSSFDDLKVLAISDTDQTALANGRALAQKIEASLKDTRTALHDAIDALKVAITADSSSTATVTP